MQFIHQVLNFHGVTFLFHMYTATQFLILLNCWSLGFGVTRRKQIDYRGLLYNEFIAAK